MRGERGIFWRCVTFGFSLLFVMTLGEALLYGAVQGFAEYLPISSSAHLILLPRFLGTQDPGLTFDVFLHLGTLAATLSYFWRDWYEIIRSLFKNKKPSHLAQAILVGTVPALVAGALLHHWVESTFRGVEIICGTLI